MLNKINELLEEKLKILDSDPINAGLWEFDIAGTPLVIFKKIYRRLGVLKKYLSDMCVLNNEWNQKDCFDALLNDWIGDLIFLNPPFSKMAAFMLKVF